MSKFNLFIFYCLSWVDATINLVASAVCYYPKVEISIRWLVYVEGSKVMGMTSKTGKKRDDLEMEAAHKKEQAYSLDDGENI